MTATEITFTSGGAVCRGHHVAARSDDFSGAAGRPCVVMAHGFGGTRDTGLQGFVDGFADAGLDVLVFDYRGFGTSDGEPRQVASYRGQRADYLAAIDAARALPGVDPTRIVRWGTSYSGGHVLTAGVRDGAVAAVVAMTPAMDGATALAKIVQRSGLRPLVTLTRHGLRDLGRGLRGREPHRVPLTASPGELGFLTAPGALEG